MNSFSKERFGHCTDNHPSIAVLTADYLARIIPWNHHPREPNHIPLQNLAVEWPRLCKKATLSNSRAVTKKASTSDQYESVFRFTMLHLVQRTLPTESASDKGFDRGWFSGKAQSEPHRYFIKSDQVFRRSAVRDSTVRRSAVFERFDGSTVRRIFGFSDFRILDFPPIFRFSDFPAGFPAIFRVNEITAG